MEKVKITEEMRLEKEWFEEARKQTLETLPKFIDHVMNDYEHDYGTVCHAISACAIAAAWAANASEMGGITGFQAGFVMWDFIRQWSYPNNKTSLKIVNYDDILYPQYGYKFEKTLTKRTWEGIQEEAARRLKEKEERGYPVHPDVKAHWEGIVAGQVPFGFTVTED